MTPRITDDGDEFHMQLNATEYDDDEMITGAKKYGLAGVVGQFIHPRNAEYNIRYLAEGSWDPHIETRSFYESYLTRLYGRDALDPLMKAFLILEKNEKAMVYWGRSEPFMAFKDWSPLEQLRTNVDYHSSPLTIKLEGPERVNEAVDERSVKETKTLDRAELERAIHATWGMSIFWWWRKSIAPQHAADLTKTEAAFYESRAAECRKALDLLRQARGKVLPGSRAELEYVIYKTDTFIRYLDVLAVCHEAIVTLDRAWLGLFDGNQVEFGIRLDECKGILDRVDRSAREIAGQMIAYGDDPTEKYLLLRFNRNVIASIENAQKYVAGVIADQKGSTRPNEKGSTKDPKI